MLGLMKGTYLAVKELRAINPKALQGMRGVGLDFTKPFICIHTEGNFTNNTIRKEVEKYLNKITSTDDFQGTSYRYSIFLLIEPHYTWDSELNVVKLVNDNWESDSLRKCGIRYPYNLNTYVSKKRINEVRKDNPKYFIIAQEKRYKLPLREDKDIDYNERVVLHEVNYYGGQEKRIYNVNCYQRGNKNVKAGFKPVPIFAKDGSIQAQTNSTDIIDKSGYRVDFIRYDLQGRAKKYKAEKEKIKAKETSMVEEIGNIKNEINTIRLKLADYMRDTENPNWSEVSSVTRAVKEVLNRCNTLETYEFLNINQKKDYLIVTGDKIIECMEILKEVINNGNDII